MSSESHEYDIHEYRRGFSRKTISSIREVPLTIFLNGREVVTLLCTAKYPEYLAVGFLKSDAFISSPAQITDLTVRDEGDRLTAEVETCHDPWKDRIMERSITSGCGKGTNFGRNVATISKRTVGGDVHVSPEQILALAKELHERSTLYKTTRGCHNSSLCTPEEILLKVVRIGVPVLASTAVATSFSVELARKTGITLIGNIRDDSFWVYNDNGRIIGF